jgi:hypothetical protein
MRSLLVVVALGLGLAACASGREDPIPGSRDAGRRMDATVRIPDAGEPPVDGSAPIPDGGPVGTDSGPASTDAGPRIDSGPPCMDMDGDGFTARSCGGEDCNDRASAINPDVLEVCDSIDNDCNLMIDDTFECPLGATPAPCMTTCGTMGQASCNSACARGPCVAPAELCGNMCDDDADGLVDEMCSPTSMPPNDTCTTAIDITVAGTYMGDTCGGDNTLDLGAGAPGCSVPVTPGTPDVFYQVRTRPAGSSYVMRLTPGFAMQFVPSICSGNGGCGPFGDGTFSIGGGGGTTWYFAVERSDGGCGPFTMMVEGM